MCLLSTVLKARSGAQAWGGVQGIFLSTALGPLQGMKRGWSCRQRGLCTCGQVVARAACIFLVGRCIYGNGVSMQKDLVLVFQVNEKLVREWRPR